MKAIALACSAGVFSAPGLNQVLFKRIAGVFIACYPANPANAANVRDRALPAR
jgi:hypothetical protein